MSTETRSSPTDAELNEEIIRRDSDLAFEISLFNEIDPAKQAQRVIDLPGYTQQEKQLLKKAVDHTLKTYDKKKRRFSDTYAVLHALGLAIPAPSEGVPPISVTIGRLFHDLAEDFFGINPSDFKDYGSEVVTIVDAMTRGRGEAYDSYIMRLAKTDHAYPHLMIAPSKGRDMRRNALDPYAFPFEFVERNANTRRKMPDILNKYAQYSPLLRMYGNSRIPNVGNAVQIGRRANASAYLTIER